MEIVQLKLDTAIGPLYLTASEHDLTGIHWQPQEQPAANALTGLQNSILARARSQLDDYFLGKRFTFDLPLAAAGTVFQKKVWQALSEIPYGSTWSYQQLAVHIKHVNASRAVGTANGRNPLAIVIPCHRVIAADGSLGGFAGGLDVKRKLLALESKEVVS